MNDSPSHGSLLLDYEGQGDRINDTMKISMIIDVTITMTVAMTVTRVDPLMTPC